MGPRPLGRGWIADMAWLEANVYASMGPRPLGRGWPLAGGAPRRRMAGFNGAATARSRMACSRSARPAAKLLLQWGRDR